MQLHLWGGMAPSSEVGNAVANMRGWALASTRPPLLEHRNVLVVRLRLIQGREAARNLTIAAAVGKRLP